MSVRADLRLSGRGTELARNMREFLHEEVLPAEPEYYRQRKQAPQSHGAPAVLEDLKSTARARGLWNLFLSAESGISQLDYAAIAELSGWSQDLAPEAINGQAPDSGNMELLHLFGTDEQKSTWLSPLLAGTIRSAFAMTEPDVASSDARNITTSIVRDGDDYVINGRKWWTTGIMDPRCAVMIVMGQTDPAAPPHAQQSMVLVPTGTPGITIVRDLGVFGRHDHQGHAEVLLTDVRVPIGNRLGAEGAGFAMAQARLGPGRIHHCMRAIGAAERGLTLLIDRATTRIAFGGPLADRDEVIADIAEARIAIDQARLLCLTAAATIDTDGVDAASSLVSMAKVAVPRAVLRVLDRAIQIHGGAGVSDVVPLAAMWGWHRAMRIFDGPDEVHIRTIGRSETRQRSAHAAISNR